MKSADLIKEAESAGYKLVSIRGSHHKLQDAEGRIIVIPHPKKDLGKGLVAKIRKQIGTA